MSKKLRALRKRVNNLEQTHSGALTNCAPLAFQERFNTGPAGSLAKVKVECPDASATMIDAGYEVYKNLCLSCPVPSTDGIIASRVFKKKYSDRNADNTPDTFDLWISADEDFWVDVDVFCCARIH
ncbi:MAG: hypothetical protein J0M12_05525 [Deltaproteobacteria bacterium]|nr:hypothetical protein [Deltaproteobacteria bacterium]